MNNMQILCMDAAGETGEVIFRTPCSVGSGEVRSQEPVNDASGTTWMGMRVAAWTWDANIPLPGGHNTVRQFATHWSTGPKHAERLYRESDVRAAIAKATGEQP